MLPVFTVHRNSAAVKAISRPSGQSDGFSFYLRRRE
jgi:hypothetical protein